MDRPPGVDFAMGVALFAIIVLVFITAQTAVFVAGVMERAPEAAPGGFSLALLNDAAFLERMESLMQNGDLVARAALWSGLAGSLVVLLMGWLWKRGGIAGLLGFARPTLFGLLKWTGIFLGLAMALELVANWLPSFRTDFMEKVIESTTDMTMLMLGVGVMAPLFEELLLRGLLFGTLRHLYDEHVSVAVVAGVFTLMHLQYPWPVLMLILPMGVVLGYARARTGSLLVPIVLHVLNNMATIALGLGT